MAKRWRIHPHDPARVARLERAAGISAVLAQLLITRGVDSAEAASQFLDCKLAHLRDPAELPGVPEAARIVMAAVESRERIVIYGDYDVDGMTGTSLLCQCLAMLGGNVGYYVPHRLDEGYGLNHEALATLAAQGAKLVVTVDCGITSVDEARRARDLGLDLIITDHHEPHAELPAARAIVHPRLPGTSYLFGGLSGSGVAFKLAWAVCQQASRATRVAEPMKQFLLSAVGLAALGTVADVVPLVDENRVLVHHGLASIKDRAGVGLAALLRVTELDRKPRLDSEDVGFTLAPRLNAAGRFGQAQLAVELLTTSSHERAQALAEYIHELNSSRQSLERSILLAANKQAQAAIDADPDAPLVLAERGWHAGIIGIVAGRLAEKYHRPVVLIALDEMCVKLGAGSARSIPGFDLHRALAACSARLASHGGHAAAAGLKIEEASLDAFRAEFCEYCASELSGSQRVAELWIDAEAPLAALTLASVEQIERLAPFGAHNPRPTLCATGVSLAEPPKKMGGGERHLSLRLSQQGAQMRGVLFGGGEHADELSKIDGPMAIAFRPVINDFRGRRTVELHVSDWKPATKEALATA